MAEEKYQDHHHFDDKEKEEKAVDARMATRFDSTTEYGGHNEIPLGFQKLSYQARPSRIASRKEFNPLDYHDRVDEVCQSRIAAGAVSLFALEAMKKDAAEVRSRKEGISLIGFSLWKKKIEKSLKDEETKGKKHKHPS